MITIPYQFVPPKVLVKGGRYFYGVSKILGGFFPTVNLNLQRAGTKLDISRYLSYCLFNDFFLFSILWLLFFLFLPITGVKDVSLLPPLLVIGFIVFFIFIQQLIYPSIIVQKKSNDIEKNLVAALKTLNIQLSAGVSLFNALVTVSNEDYGELSRQFKEVIHNINTGTKQIEALEKMIDVNTSDLFRRSMWQIINGMKTGTDLNIILGEIINSLSEEQIVQIQQYGSRLTPLAMFYMILVVIVPSLSVVFLLLLGSMANLSEFGLKMIFWSVLVLVIFVQYAFIGMIKSKRPVLLGD